MQRLSPMMPVFGDTALLSQILLQYSCAPPLQTSGRVVRMGHDSRASPRSWTIYRTSSWTWYERRGSFFRVGQRRPSPRSSRWHQRWHHLGRGHGCRCVYFRYEFRCTYYNTKLIKEGVVTWGQYPEAFEFPAVYVVNWTKGRL